MKRYLRVFFLLYFAGFAAGILCADLLHRGLEYQTSLLPVYLSASLEDEQGMEKLFGELLLRRGGFFLAGIFCGLTPMGIPLVLISLLWFGFLAGNLMTLFLLEYGIKGMGLGTACFMPQALFYIPGWLFFFFLVAQMSQKCWGKVRREKGDYQAYLFFVSGACVCVLLGIWMESYVNQNLLHYIFTEWI